MGKTEAYHELHSFTGGKLEVMAKSVRVHSQTTMGNPHFHEHFEVVHVIKGQEVCIVEGQRTTLDPGCTIIIPPDTIHSYYSVCPEGSAHYVCLFNTSILNFDNQKIGHSRYLDIFSYGGAFACLFPPYKKQEQIREILRRMSLEYTMQHPGYDYQIRGLVYQLLGYITYNGNHLIQNASHPTHCLDIKELCQYIEENYWEDLSLATMAAKLNYSKEHFSRLFKKVVGKNYKEFVDYVKINEAERMLLNYNIPVQEAASRVGYTNPYSFSRAFKRIKGYSPSESEEKHN